MKTAKGSNYATLLSFVIEEGELTVRFKVPMDTPGFNTEYRDKALPVINERISTEKKPGATFEKCLERIDHHSRLYVESIVNLVNTVDSILNPQKQVRTSPIDKARTSMLQSMDNTMLKQFGVTQLGKDAMNEFILPDDKDNVIAAIVAKMKESE